MTKAPASGAGTRKASPPRSRKRSRGRTNVVRRAVTGSRVVFSKARFDAVMEAAKTSGLLGEKSGRIAGRVSEALLAQAKRQTGIKSDTDLIEFALATVALEDKFPGAFKEARGKVDPGLKLGF